MWESRMDWLEGYLNGYKGKNIELLIRQRKHKKISQGPPYNINGETHK